MKAALIQARRLVAAQLLVAGELRTVAVRRDIQRRYNTYATDYFADLYTQD